MSFRPEGIDPDELMGLDLECLAFYREPGLPWPTDAEVNALVEAACRMFRTRRGRAMILTEAQLLVAIRDRAVAALEGGA